MDNNIRRLVEEVLEKGYLMSIGTNDKSGIWVCDVIYVYDKDLNLYWMSDPDVRHSKAIEKEENIAGTITVSGRKEDNLGIQFVGVAKKINGKRFDLVVKHFLKRGKVRPKKAFDALQGDAWYMLKVKQFDLINEKLFGFEKKKVKIDN